MSCLSLCFLVAVRLPEVSPGGSRGVDMWESPQNCGLGSNVGPQYKDPYYNLY